MIELKHLTKRWDGFTLHDISAKLPTGYIVGLIGPNGSGKTTLLQLLLGLYQPTAGGMTIDGKNYDSAECTLHDALGLVLQERLFDGNYSLEENADLYGSYYSRYERETFRSYCQRFGLNPLCRYRTLSKGEELKFQFAFALSHHPVWLLLDEPTGNFDPKFRSEFLRLLKAFVADENHGIVLATHLTDDLDRLADYILYLEKGELLLSMDVEEMRQAFRLVAGETYKVRLLPEEHVILRQENEFGAKALVRHRAYMQYDKALHVASPSIEELMYFMTKRKKPLPDFNKDASRDTFS